MFYVSSHINKFLTTIHDSLTSSTYPCHPHTYNKERENKNNDFYA